MLLKAEELKFHFNFSSELWQIEQGGTPLNEVLGKVFKCSKNFLAESGREATRQRVNQLFLKDLMMSTEFPTRERRMSIQKAEETFR